MEKHLARVPAERGKGQVPSVLSSLSIQRGEDGSRGMGDEGVGSSYAWADLPPSLPWQQQRIGTLATLALVLAGRYLERPLKINKVKMKADLFHISTR